MLSLWQAPLLQGCPVCVPHGHPVSAPAWLLLPLVWAVPTILLHLCFLVLRRKRLRSKGSPTLPAGSPFLALALNSSQTQAKFN